jgi:hypothetical protein
MEFLYEKDLRSMQYNILVSERHDQVVRDLAGRSGARKQQIQKKMMDSFDMILLENLPARYEVGLEMGDAEDEIARALGRELITRYIPLLGRDTADRIVEETREKILQGMPRESAIHEGLEKIREMILS